MRATRRREVLVEDPLHDRRGDRVGLEAVQPLTVAALAGFGCGPASASR